MAIRVLANVLDHSPQKANKLVALIVLANNCNDDGWTWLKQETIAKRVRVTKRAVQRILDQLEAEGEIVIYNRTDKGNAENHFSNLYHLPRYGVADSKPPGELPGTLRLRTLTQGSDAAVATPSDSTVARGSDPGVVGVATPRPPDPLIKPNTSKPKRKEKRHAPAKEAVTVVVSERIVSDTSPDETPRLYPATHREAKDLIQTWFRWMPQRLISKAKVVLDESFFYKPALTDIAFSMVQRGVVCSDIVTFFGDVEFENDPSSPVYHIAQRWRGKKITFTMLAEIFDEWIPLSRGDDGWTETEPRIEPRVPGITLYAHDFLVDDLVERFRGSALYIVDIPLRYITIQEAHDILNPEHRPAAPADPPEPPDDQQSDAKLLAELGVPV